MAASAEQPARRLEQYGRLWWLPADGEGNGLDDTAWAPLAAGDAATMRALLAELRLAGVPAYTAPARHSPSLRGRRSTATASAQARNPPGSNDRYELWVGTSRYGRAEEILRVRLPALLRASGRKR